jgi:hypothetical protein
MDTCLSNYRELFALGSPFHDYSLDLQNTGHYYVRFHRLMEHWKKLFPERILEIQYEELVAAQEATTRRLLAFCDLPWRDECLRFQENKAAVTTASLVQVREPLYRGAIGRWKRYEAHLGGLHALLTHAGINCDN